MYYQVLPCIAMYNHVLGYIAIYYILKQWIVFFARSDWLLKVRLSSAIHCFTSNSSERATPNSRNLRAKCVVSPEVSSNIVFVTARA